MIDEVFDALDEQTVDDPGTGTLDIAIRPWPARSPPSRTTTGPGNPGNELEAHPLSPVLTALPGVDVMTAAVLLVTVGDGTSFPNAAPQGDHL